jgi:hypothetical protein
MNQGKDKAMGIGGGITLIVLGLIFLTGVIQFDIPGLNEQALGVILVLGGIAAIVLTQTIWRDRGVTGPTVSEPRGSTGRVVEREVIERDVPPDRI